MTSQDSSPDYFGLVPAHNLGNFIFDETKIAAHAEELSPSIVIVDFFNHRLQVESERAPMCKIGKLVLTQHDALTSDIYSVIYADPTAQTHKQRLKVASLIVPKNNELARLGETHAYGQENPAPFQNRDYSVMRKLYQTAIYGLTLR